MSIPCIPKIGLIVVGDEILSGLRQDKHIPAIIERLAERGLSLSWVQIVGDDPDHLTKVLSQSFQSNQVVFSCGGIGGTPDDQTRQAAAKALGVPIVRHSDAVSLILERCQETGQKPDEYRLRMADFPKGAALIPNPYNNIAGFSIQQHYFVPGFPVMAWPMIEWVLDSYYKHFHHTQLEHKRSLLLFDTPEANITPVMEQLELQFSPCKLYSLPSVGGDGFAKHIELGVKLIGLEKAKANVDSAFYALVGILTEMKCHFQVI